VKSAPDTIPGPDNTYGSGALDVAGAYDLLCPAAGLDSDADGIADSCDNCINVSNGPLTTIYGTPITLGSIQLDSDRDGYGNACDADFNNNGIVDPQDNFNIRNAVGSLNLLYDMNGNGIVDPQDAFFTRTLVGSLTGPSAFVP